MNYYLKEDHGHPDANLELSLYNLRRAFKH